MKKAIFIICITLSLELLALPSLTNRCGEYGVNLRLPVESDIIAYNKECDTVFIGPPSSGTAEVVSMNRKRRFFSYQFCS